MRIQDVLILDLDAPGATRGPVDIEIVDGRIARIAHSVRPNPQDSDTRLKLGGAAGRVIDGAGLLAIPGLVNAHLHSSGHFSRGLLDNLPLELFMLWELPPLEAEPSPPELYRARVLSGAVQMLKSGITSVMDDPIYTPDATDEAIDAVMGAYRDVGLRATVSIYQPNKTEYDWFPYLPQLLPPDLRRRMGEQSRPSTAQIMQTYRAFFERWHGAADGRLRCAASCSAPQRATDDYLTGLHKLAADWGLPLVMHVYESKVQRVAGELLYGRSLVRHVRDLGALDERTVVVHAVWVDDQDISDLAEASCTVVHSPSGNLRCGSGIMPYRDLMRAGVHMALCTDEATVEDTCSLWSAGRLAAQLHKITGPDYEAWPTAEEILRAHRLQDPHLVDEQVLYLHHPAQQGHLEALLEDKSAGDVERLGAPHGEVVDGAVDGQLADVAPGEEQRRHHVGVGGHGQRGAVDVEDRLVAHGVAEGGLEEGLNQGVGGLAPGAVGHVDGLVADPGRLPADVLDAVQHLLLVPLSDVLGFSHRLQPPRAGFGFPRLESGDH